MKIAFACDHAGFILKQSIIDHLKERGCEVTDFGCYTPERVDYPILGEKAARAVSRGECDLGILVCGTGIGISLAANRVRGIRAAACAEPYAADMARRHNNLNVLAIGARVVGEGTAISIVDAFLDAEFEGGRHAKRLAMLDEIQP